MTANRRITIMGHPIHPATVHFPIGLLGTLVLWDALGLLGPEVFWWGISHWVLVVGLLFAGVALTSGFIDYLGLPEEGRVMSTANRHMVVMLLASSLFLGRLLLHGGDGPPPSSARMPALLLSVGGALLLLAGGWLGGSLVYRHGAGRVEEDTPGVGPGK